MPVNLVEQERISVLDLKLDTREKVFTFDPEKDISKNSFEKIRKDFHAEANYKLPTHLVGEFFHWASLATALFPKRKRDFEIVGENQDFLKNMYNTLKDGTVGLYGLSNIARGMVLIFPDERELVTRNDQIYSKLKWEVREKSDDLEKGFGHGIWLIKQAFNFKVVYPKEEPLKGNDFIFRKILEHIYGFRDDPHYFPGYPQYLAMMRFIFPERFREILPTHHELQEIKDYIWFRHRPLASAEMAWALAVICAKSASINEEGIEMIPNSDGEFLQLPERRKY